LLITYTQYKYQSAIKNEKYYLTYAIKSDSILGLSTI